MIDRNGRAKISGFRYSCSLIETTTEEMCLPAVGCALQDRYDYPLYVANKHLNWMSPEILQQVSSNMRKYCYRKFREIDFHKFLALTFFWQKILLCMYMNLHT